MCKECYNKYTQGKELNPSPKIYELAGRILAWYSYEINSVGGPFHVVLDDWNLEDKIIQFCLISVEHDYPFMDQFLELGRILLEVSEVERAYALGLTQGMVR